MKFMSLFCDKLKCCVIISRENSSIAQCRRQRALWAKDFLECILMLNFYYTFIFTGTARFRCILDNEYIFSKQKSNAILKAQTIQAV